MRRLIIHLLVALLTFALGTIASLLLQGGLASSSKSVSEQSVAARPETQRALLPESVPTSRYCACAGGDLDSLPPASDTQKAPIHGGVLNGKAISLPKPPYPPIAKAARAGGTVVVQIVIDERGCVQSARVAGGHPLLHAAAVQAARHACFKPTLLSGQPVKVTGIITYNFARE